MRTLCLSPNFLCKVLIKLNITFINSLFPHPCINKCVYREKGSSRVFNKNKNHYPSRSVQNRFTNAMISNLFDRPTQCVLDGGTPAYGGRQRFIRETKRRSTNSLRRCFADFLFFFIFPIIEIEILS